MMDTLLVQLNFNIGQSLEGGIFLGGREKEKEGEKEGKGFITVSSSRAGTINHPPRPLPSSQFSLSLQSLGEIASSHKKVTGSDDDCIL